jgi:5-methylthioadenosine/S-adenosylhomocysteine deaminase
LAPAHRQSAPGPQEPSRWRHGGFDPLALAASGGFGNPAIAEREWSAAREVGARITIHAGGKGQIQNSAKAFKLGRDTTYVHCAGWDETDWKMVAESGSTVSISPGTEMFISMNIPPIQ